MTRRSLRRDLDLFAEVYNSAWSRNWGFVPYSKEDLDAYALDLQLVFSPEWFMVAEQDGEAVAMAITVLDANQVLRKMNGRLLPLGWWHFLRRNHTSDRLRVGFLGVKPEFQHTGVAALLYVEHFNAAERSPPQTRRGRVHPRDQPRHEQRPGSDERAGRQALPGLRAQARRGRRRRTRLGRAQGDDAVLAAEAEGVGDRGVTGPSRAVRATWSRSHSGSGEVRLIVGGSAESRIASRQAIAESAPGGADQVPDHRLRRADRDAVGRGAERRADRLASPRCRWRGSPVPCAQM